MRVLVTGGSGFLGSHVAEQLTRDGHTVVALVRKSSNRKFLSTLPNLELAEGGVEDRAAVDRAMKDVDAVVHSAGLVKARSEAEFRQTNTEGTVNLLEAAREHAPNLKRFVHVSSLEACGPSLDGKPVEPSQEQPVTAYGRSKLAAEKEVLVRKDKLPVVILRPAAIYGPRDIEIFEAFLAASRRQYPVIGDGSMVACYTYGPDCARACVAAINADIPSGSVYFVDDGEPLPMSRAMGEILHEALGTSALVRFGVPFPVLRLASIGVEAYGRVRGRAVMLTREKVAALRNHWVCESKRTREELGWQPEVTFPEGAKLTAAWYRENGWL
ncbi:MAG: NAD(P)-dependent oxidoreductase [Labilithrix sp.]|nr:NAD(P)-dependent oxidoreductase [Labilithrix sp.]MCW5810382.1 NAD(P)-dependent oxidoreductase [Labilithrix sp.]